MLGILPGLRCLHQTRGDSFSGQLGTVKRGLEESHSAIDSYDSDYGHGSVRDAMHHFESHWRDGRGHVQHTATSLASMVTEAVKAYAKVDEDLAKQLLQKAAR